MILRESYFFIRLSLVFLLCTFFISCGDEELTGYEKITTVENPFLLEISLNSEKEINEVLQVFRNFSKEFDLVESTGSELFNALNDHEDSYFFVWSEKEFNFILQFTNTVGKNKKLFICSFFFNNSSRASDRMEIFESKYLPILFEIDNKVKLTKKIN